jgi:S-formylglutathione hydrolase FrmB
MVSTLGGYGMQTSWTLPFCVTLVVMMGSAWSDVGSAQNAAKKGTVERIKIHGPSLEGNLANEPASPEVTVYLPPSYAAERSRRYPVVYLLHGYTGTDSTWTGRLANLPESADKLAATGAARELIVVMPNAFNVYAGSMYSNSVTTGNWEGYIADDLVAYVDKTYRTIPERNSRGLAGHSMGGYGTIRIGMKRPDVFSSVYLMSACCLTANISPRSEAMAASERLRTREDVQNAIQAGRGGFGLVMLAQAAAWSPNPANPPLYFDLPVKNGEIQPAIIAKWAANAPLAMLDQYVPSLKRLNALAIDIGDKDGLIGSNRELDEALTRFGVAHTFEVYDGDHVNKVGERVEQKVLPFFATKLSHTASRSGATR